MFVFIAESEDALIHGITAVGRTAEEAEAAFMTEFNRVREINAAHLFEHVPECKTFKDVVFEFGGSIRKMQVGKGYYWTREAE